MVCIKINCNKKQNDFMIFHLLSNSENQRSFRQPFPRACVCSRTGLVCIIFDGEAYKGESSLDCIKMNCNKITHLRAKTFPLFRLRTNAGAQKWRRERSRGVVLCCRVQRTARGGKADTDGFEVRVRNYLMSLELEMLKRRL